MIVCICKNINEAKVKEASKLGSFKNFIKTSGLGGECGKCLSCAKYVFNHPDAPPYLSEKESPESDSFQ